MPRFNFEEALEFYKYGKFLFCDGTKTEDNIKALGAKDVEGLLNFQIAPSQHEIHTQVTELGRIFLFSNHIISIKSFPQTFFVDTYHHVAYKHH